ncbi:hypothetical protein DEV91_12936 [Phyllobacterium brassicacearum]|nr:hypothetical protein DEV91_12936 [Phyllobacterium brassicacearum]
MRGNKKIITAFGLARGFQFGAYAAVFTIDRGFELQHWNFVKNGFNSFR